MPVPKTNNIPQNKEKQVYVFIICQCYQAKTLPQCTVGDHCVVCTIHFINTKKKKKKKKDTTKTPIIHLIRVSNLAVLVEYKKVVHLNKVIFIPRIGIQSVPLRVQCTGPVHQCSSGYGFTNQRTFLPNSSGGRNTAASPHSLI